MADGKGVLGAESSALPSSCAEVSGAGDCARLMLRARTMKLLPLAPCDELRRRGRGRFSTLMSSPSSESAEAEAVMPSPAVGVISAAIASATRLAIVMPEAAMSTLIPRRAT